MPSVEIVANVLHVYIRFFTDSTSERHLKNTVTSPETFTDKQLTRVKNGCDSNSSSNRKDSDGHWKKGCSGLTLKTHRTTAFPKAEVKRDGSVIHFWLLWQGKSPFWRSFPHSYIQSNGSLNLTIWQRQLKTQSGEQTTKKETLLKISQSKTLIWCSSMPSMINSEFFDSPVLINRKLNYSLSNNSLFNLSGFTHPAFYGT